MSVLMLLRGPQARRHITLPGDTFSRYHRAGSEHLLGLRRHELMEHPSLCTLRACQVSPAKQEPQGAIGASFLPKVAGEGSDRTKSLAPFILALSVPYLGTMMIFRLIF